MNKLTENELRLIYGGINDTDSTNDPKKNLSENNTSVQDNKTMSDKKPEQISGFVPLQYTEIKYTKKRRYVNYRPSLYSYK